MSRGGPIHSNYAKKMSSKERKYQKFNSLKLETDQKSLDFCILESSKLIHLDELNEARQANEKKMEEIREIKRLLKKRTKTSTNQ